MPGGAGGPVPPCWVAVTVEAAKVLFELVVHPAQHPAARGLVGRLGQVLDGQGQPVAAAEGGVEGVQIERDHVARRARGIHRGPVVVAGVLVGGRQPPRLVVLGAGHEAQGAVGGVEVIEVDGELLA
jgi:hypothetical protein